MLNKILKIVDIVLQPKMLKMLFSIGSSGYLKEMGWINSYKQMMPVDKNNNPLPWVTYGFIDFISNRLNSTMDIFEYGSGNSTLWYAKKVNSVVSVENDKHWYNKIKESMPKNVNINYKEFVNDGEYSKFSNTVDRKFDIIIVDGQDRVNCIKNAINAIKEGGVVVLDDSEREYYKDGIAFLLYQGFKRIDFWGISPGLFYKKNTTIFYKNDNCLEI